MFYKKERLNSEKKKTAKKHH